VAIATARHGYTGAEVSAWLAERGIDVEMADVRRVVLVPSVCDPPDALDQVADALLMMPARPPLSEEDAAPLPPMEARMRVREATLSLGEWTPLERAAGRVAAGSAGFYPPGIPLIVPGELVTPEAAALLARPGQRFGVEGGCIRCVGGEG
jgi:lysine decarboxylase